MLGAESEAGSGEAPEQLAQSLVNGPENGASTLPSPASNVSVIDGDVHLDNVIEVLIFLSLEIH